MPLVTGVDSSTISLQKAKRQDLSRRVRYLPADAHHLPFPTQSFEAIAAMDILEHVEEPIFVIQECARVLKPGGRLLLRMLTGEKEHTSPELSGPGAVVKFVSAKDDLMQLAVTSCFSGLRLLKYDDPPCFVHDGIAMRETQIESFKA